MTRQQTLTRAALILLPLCLTLPGARANDLAQRDNLNGGYYLLHHLLDDESNVPILLDLKHAPKDIQDFATEIGKTAKEGEAVLEKMREADPRLNWDKNPLPRIEQDVRASITDEKQHQLLFGSKDNNFVRAFLVSQCEASKYAANIAKVLTEQDPSREHQRDLARISGQWHALYDKDFKLLQNY